MKSRPRRHKRLVDDGEKIIRLQKEQKIRKSVQREEIFLDQIVANGGCHRAAR